MTNETQEACGICLADLNDCPAHKLECGHCFHTQCIIQWFRVSNVGECPQCRATTPETSHFQHNSEERSLYLSAREIHKMCAHLVYKPYQKMFPWERPLVASYMANRRRLLKINRDADQYSTEQRSHVEKDFLHSVQKLLSYIATLDALVLNFGQN